MTKHAHTPSQEMPSDTDVDASSLATTSVPGGHPGAVSPLATHEITGEPLLPVTGIWATALLGAASLFAGVALLSTELNLARYDILAAWYTRRLAPAPGTFWHLTAALFCALILLPSLVTAGVTAFYIRRGHRWTRWAALASAALGSAALLIHWVSFPIILFSTLGAGLLFLPPMRRFFNEFSRVRSEETRVSEFGSDPVHYGPVGRYREFSTNS